jgi:hypothetical protein
MSSEATAVKIVAPLVTEKAFLLGIPSCREVRELSRGCEVNRAPVRGAATR